jgi:hypothetical protein
MLMLFVACIGAQMLWRSILRKGSSLPAPTALDEQRDDSRRYQRPSPQKVDVKPCALEYHQPEFLVNYDRYRTHYREHCQRVKPNRCEIGKNCC